MENGFPHLIFNKNVVMWLKWAFQMRKGVKSFVGFGISKVDRSDCQITKQLEFLL
jgi:hypothetical protein